MNAQPERRPIRPIVSLAAGAVFISFAPVLVKLLNRWGVGASAIGAWRMTCGGIVFLSLAASLGARLSMPRRRIAAALGAGVAVATNLFVWHRSILIVGAGVATILASTQVFWTSGFGRLVYRERLSPRFVAAAALAFAGVAMLGGLGSEVELGSRHLLGLGLGLAAGVCYASYILLVQRGVGGGATRRGGNRATPMVEVLVFLGWAGLVCGALLFAAAAIEGERLLAGSRSIAAIAAMVLFPQVLGWLSIAGGLRRAPASSAALVLLLQPALATVWGVVFLAEKLHPLQVGGAAVTLLAVRLGTGGPSSPD